MCIIHNKYYRNHKELKCDALSEKILPHCLRATDTTKQKWFLTVNFPLLSTAKPNLTNKFQCTTMKKKVACPTQILEHIFSCSSFINKNEKSFDPTVMYYRIFGCNDLEVFKSGKKSK